MIKAFEELQYWLDRYGVDPATVEVRLICRDAKDQRKVEWYLTRDLTPMTAQIAVDTTPRLYTINGITLKIEAEPPSRPRGVYPERWLG